MCKDSGFTDTADESHTATGITSATVEIGVYLVFGAPHRIRVAIALWAGNSIAISFDMSFQKRSGSSLIMSAFFFT
jgi:hypothetical protein